MGRFTVFGDEGLAVFSQQYVSKGCTARLPEENEKPTIAPRDGEIGIYPVLFEQIGLKLPLDHLLCNVLRRCNMALCQLCPNGIKIVLGYTALNKLLGVKLTWREILYCYSFCNCPKDTSRYYFRTQIKAPDLVKDLTKSKKGYYEGMVVIGVSWEDGNIVKIRRRVHSHVGRDLY